MIAYIRSTAILVAVATFLGGVVWLNVAGKWIDETFKGYLLRYLVRALPVLPLLVVFYVLNIGLIIISQPSEYRERVKERWKEFLDGGARPSLLGSAQDFADRAAACSVWWYWRRHLK